MWEHNLCVVFFFSPIFCGCCCATKSEKFSPVWFLYFFSRWIVPCFWYTLNVAKMMITCYESCNSHSVCTVHQCFLYLFPHECDWSQLHCIVGFSHLMYTKSIYIDRRHMHMRFYMAIFLQSIRFLLFPFSSSYTFLCDKYNRCNRPPATGTLALFI